MAKMTRCYSATCKGSLQEKVQCVVTRVGAQLLRLECECGEECVASGTDDDESSSDSRRLAQT
eukprot:4586132-Amphidinium_carterae.2